MTDYAKSVNFAVKDTLTSGDPNKIVSGAEIDTEFNNVASSSTTKIDKVPAAGTGNLAQFTTTGAISDSGKTLNEVIPSGVILMWSGGVASIPSGWSLCDGTNGTPDLRDRFVVGAGGSYAVDATGGADSVTLTESEIPSHSHSMNSAGDHSHSGSTSTDGSHRHTYGRITNGSDGSGEQVGGGSDDGSFPTSFAGAHNHSFTTNTTGSHTHTITNTGGDGSHENRPPYLALAYIMKL